MKRSIVLNSAHIMMDMQKKNKTQKSSHIPGNKEFYLQLGPWNFFAKNVNFVLMLMIRKTEFIDGWWMLQMFCSEWLLPYLVAHIIEVGVCCHLKKGENLCAKKHMKNYDIVGGCCQMILSWWMLQLHFSCQI